MVLEYKLLVFNNLRNALIFRVFASEGLFARKYALIFWGRTENSDEKSRDDENLKVPHIVLLPAEGNNVMIRD